MNNLYTQQLPIAIIGIGCIFPQSPDATSFLRLLIRGINAISDPPETQRHLLDYFDPDPKRPDHIYCVRGGYLPSIDFDPSEFGIPPTALEATDTSQLLGLVVAKQALADAGYGENGQTFDRDKTSIILGVTGTQELVIPLGARLGHPVWRRALADSGIPADMAEAVIERISDGFVPWQENSFPGLLGNVVAGRIANRLDLGGTNCVVDAACASSMSAIHMALMELTSGRSDMVLTGGVDTLNDVFMHMCFAKTQILSASGEIRPFSQHADGTVLGEGVGMVVLKRLDDAQRDGNRIYAVIKGLGSASDGKSQSIYAPRASGQAAALRKAYQYAGVAPESVDLVEAHGTGTRVGDQVEFKALCDVFGSESANGNRCALGSVKSNIGHTKAAAGIAGLIKAALSLYHKVLPPTLKAQPVDTNLSVEHSPFYINHALRPWNSADGRFRRAGVSAFGFGGSNFHTVLQEYDAKKQEPSWDGSVEIVAFSGATKQSIADQIEQFSQEISSQRQASRITCLAAKSRQHFKADDAHRLLVVLAPAHDIDQTLKRCQEALQRILATDGVESESIHFGSGAPKGGIAFLFPGQGSQYVGMGRDLICCFPASLEAFQEAEKQLPAPHALSEYLFPRLPGDATEYETRLRKTDIAQPAIGAICVALLEALTYFGITPAATCGHSYGELVALHAAGWMDRETLWQLSIARGHLMAQAGQGSADPGSMLAVNAPIEELHQMVQASAAGVLLANRNSPHQGVLSGPTAAIDAAEQVCRQKGLKSVRLPVAAAFHSSLVAGAQAPFQKLVDTIRITPNHIAVMSNTTAQAYPSDVDQVKALLGGQLAQPVDFMANVEHLYKQGIRTFVEVGPKTVLTRLIGATLKGRDFQAMALDRSSGRDIGLIDLAKTLAQLAASGHEVRLERWEKPLPEARTPRMRVSVSGANYRTPPVPRSKTPIPTVLNQNAVTAPAIHDSSTISKPALTAQALAVPTTALPESKFMGFDSPILKRDTMDNSKKNFLSQALSAVQQGLSSMQALQSQTTKAHEKYLETQAEANRALQQMMQSTQHLTAAFMGNGNALERMPAFRSLPVADERQTLGKPAQISKGIDAPASSPNLQGEANASPLQAIVVKEAIPNKVAISGATAGSRPLETIRQSLLTIVSELTGYPEQMLGLEMDIEADLGIDSIKRVEILSALEEEMPHLPRVTPDMVGTLKTLGHICDYLASSADHVPHAVSDSVVAPAIQSTANSGLSQIQQTLVQIVSELTGYPVEMLGLEMDIEADLGIDSIKRVEILSALEEKMPYLPKVTPDMVGTLKTLGHICDYLSNTSQNSKITLPSTDSTSSDQGPLACCVPAANATATKAIGRYEIQTVPLSSETNGQFAPAPNHFIAVVSKDEIASHALVQTLNGLGCKAQRFSKQSELGPQVKLSGLVILAPISAQEAFRWAQICAPYLQMAARKGQALFRTVTRLDGLFGWTAGELQNPEQGALSGLAKTAALEWPMVHCRAMDLAPRWPDVNAAAQALATEIVYGAAESPVEIGLTPDGRFGLQMVSTAMPEARALDLSPEDVVVVSGGARGVTAATVMALVAHAPCTLALLGRSPHPQAEPDWLAPLREEAEIKKALLHHELPGSSVAPKALEKAYRKWMANREIKSTLDQLHGKGVKANYYSIDVCDPKAVQTTTHKIRKELGRIKAVIHGAGVVEDRLITDKTMDQFQVVYDTKVKGLQSLLDATAKDDLRYLVLFSSISARMGNLGQADYAMANEVLNKTAMHLSHVKPNCKVVSINWGPWDGGMVTPSLKRTFENSGIALIPMQQGAVAMVAEMGNPNKSAVEVVIGGPLHSGDHQQAANCAPMYERSIDEQPEMVQTAKREIDVERCPVLQSHLLNGRPVVPLALMTEWLAHGALHANPGLVLHGMDHLRLLKGITLGQQTKTIRLMAGTARRSAGVYEVDVQIRDGRQNGSDLVHSSAKAILTDALPAPPAFVENGHFKASPNLPAMDDIYGRVLFHGDALRGIEKIIRLSSSGMTAKILCAPPPANWLIDPLRSRWIADPLVLDCAFQMAIIWCYEQQGVVSLPSYAASYRQYRERFPSDAVTAVLEVVNATDRKLIADFTFLDQKKKIIAQMTGYEAIMDQGLFKAFGVKAA